MARLARGKVNDCVECRAIRPEYKRRERVPYIGRAYFFFATLGLLMLFPWLPLPERVARYARATDSPSA